MVTQFMYVLCILNPWRCRLLHSCLVYDWTSLLCTFLSPDANGTCLSSTGSVNQRLRLRWSHMAIPLLRSPTFEPHHQLTPRNSQQIRNYRRSETTPAPDVLYSVILQWKLSEGMSDSFVCDLKAALDPQCVLCTDWQMSELVKVTTKQAEFSVFVADTT